MNAIPACGLVLLLTLPLAAQTTPAPTHAPTVAPTPALMPNPRPAGVATRSDCLDGESLADWAQLDRYRADDAALLPPAPGEQRVVFYGDSITDAWGHGADFFPGKPYVNRGISGQTTPQMLVRFQQDVVHLKPAAVVILAGTNDIAGNTGPETPEMIEDNFVSMGQSRSSPESGS